MVVERIAPKLTSHKRDVAKNGEVVRCFATGGIGLMLLQLHGQEVAMVRSNRTVFTVYPCFRVSGLLVRAQAFCALATNSSAILVIKCSGGHKSSPCHILLV